MSQFALIACRVPFETKMRVRQLAEREGITESTLLRQLLEVVLRTEGLGVPPSTVAAGKVNRDARVNVRLERGDWWLLKDRAKARGLASATYLSYITRSHLRDAAPLPNAEYTLLKQSVEQLAALGRNLNQIARTMNQGDRSAGPGLAELDAVLKTTEGLRQHFRGLLEANSVEKLGFGARLSPHPARDHARSRHLRAEDHWTFRPGGRLFRCSELRGRDLKV